MVTVRDVVERLPVKVVAGDRRLSREITSGYVGDLLSLVMARAPFGSVWVTVQGHPNVVAVAVLVGISAIIVSEGARIDAATLEKADQEGIPILSSAATSYDLVAELSGLGLKGAPL
ncbi:MAG: DRTGG domain-containing protein [Sphingomonadaceae bacterium]